MMTHRVVSVLGLPVSDVTFEEALAEVATMIHAGRPDYIATANLDHAMRCRNDLSFREALCAARFVTPDGMPFLWASRLAGKGLRDRVTGADLLPRTCEMASNRGYRVFLMGGEPGIADRAAERLRQSYPGLRIVGTHSPGFAPLEKLDHSEMCDAVRRARPDVLFTSLGSPKGTLWLERYLDELAVPVCLEVGAALTFAAGAARRAPRWVRRVGGEWAFRMMHEPARLGRRYGANAMFLVRRFGRACASFGSGRASGVEQQIEPSAWSLGPNQSDRNAHRRERRCNDRTIRSEEDTWQVVRQIARRVQSAASVEGDLRAADAARANVLGAVVWLYRQAIRKGVAVRLHGLPAVLRHEAWELGGRRFARWLEPSWSRSTHHEDGQAAHVVNRFEAFDRPRAVSTTAADSGRSGYGKTGYGPL
jgi:exopolysaccharide biosynthesis WecB/TagA/CpsF family protein